MEKEKNGPFEIRTSRFGKGLFAIQPIAAATVLCKASGKSLGFAQTVQLGKRESHCLQIGLDQYILCDPPFLYSNHSCNPNCALNENLELFALKDIKPGEELLWDYSTSMFERHWTMRCFCGAESCRKVINDFDLLPKDIQVDYLERKIVLPFIACQLQEKTFSRANRA